jgi:hypothetical protein
MAAFSVNLRFNFLNTFGSWDSDALQIPLLLMHQRYAQPEE